MMLEQRPWDIVTREVRRGRSEGMAGESVRNGG